MRIPGFAKEEEESDLPSLSDAEVVEFDLMLLCLVVFRCVTTVSAPNELASAWVPSGIADPWRPLAVPRPCVGAQHRV